MTPRTLLASFADNARLKYLRRCVSGVCAPARRGCPSCGDRRCHVIKRRKLITALVRCAGCRLIYRVPLDPPGFGDEYYQGEYQCGFATDCPSPERLDQLLRMQFRGSSMDFTARLEMLRALGVAPGSRILDLGASWGYGTWQFAAAGYDAVGCEIGRDRARYARERLHVRVESDIDRIGGDFDVFFSSHVLEHLPSPTIAFELAARTLKRGGLFLAFTPNGSMRCRDANPVEYHRYWGAIHPLYLDDSYYQSACAGRPTLLCSAPYDGRYDLETIARWNKQRDAILNLEASELCAAVVF